MRDSKPNYSDIPLQPSPALYGDAPEKTYEATRGFQGEHAPQDSKAKAKARRKMPSAAFKASKNYPEKGLLAAPVFQHLDDFGKPDFEPPLLHSNDSLLAQNPPYEFDFDRHQQFSSFPLHSPYPAKEYVSQLGPITNYNAQMGSPGPSPVMTSGVNMASGVNTMASSVHAIGSAATSIGSNVNSMGSNVTSMTPNANPISVPLDYSLYPMMQQDLSAMHGMISGQEVFSGHVQSKENMVVPNRPSRPHTAYTPGPVPGSTPSRKRPRSESTPDTDTSLLAAADCISASSLHDIVEKVKSVDSGDSVQDDPLGKTLLALKSGKSDKHHQALALSWVQKSCRVSHAAVVPRNRFYARYVQMCASFNVSPLLSGLFFRLVRLIFPHLKTRRLGSRGRSKYHFCGVKLIGELSVPGSPVSTYSSVGVDSPQSISYNTPSRVSSPMVSRMLQTPVSSAHSTDRFHVNDLAFLPHIHSMVESSTAHETFGRSLSVPLMSSYLPKDFDVDNDLADTLHSLYKIYCTTMLESVRYMQIERLFAAMAPSPALLSGPIFKLLVDPQVLEWVQTCDSAMYGAMLKMLARLHLSSVPSEITTPLHELASGFIEKLTVCFNSKFPQAFVDMKVKLAHRFVSLLKRLLSCIKTGARLTRILSNVQEKNAMVGDWNRIDFSDLISRIVPCAEANSEAILKLLEEKVPQFLGESATTMVTCSKFVIEIPAMFPKVTPWLFTLLSSNLLTSCLREMSSHGAKTFDSWWALRCWVDEYIMWSFELGGFFREEYHRWSFSASAKEMNQESLLTHDLSANTDVHANSLVDLLEDLSGEKDWL